MSFNRVTLVGNLGRDLDLRYTQGGSAVGTLNLATTEKWTDKQGEKQEHTEWTRCSVWGKQAETLEPFLKKGKQVLVEGSLRTRQWEKDGVKRYSTEVRVSRIVLLGSKNGARNEGDRPRPAADDFGGEDDFNPPTGEDF